MREIKFRAWDKDSQKMWFFGIEEPLLVCGEECNGLTFDDCYFVKETVMQFTGLTDKNGKEIYEGDIVKAKEEFFDVFWFEPFAAFRLRNIPQTNESLANYDDTEIIGNIYENPNLINQEK